MMNRGSMVPDPVDEGGIDGELGADRELDHSAEIFEEEDLTGELIAGKYRVLRQLGSGSTGAVYVCQHVGLDKLVALKVLHREMEQNANFVDQFKREARAASRLEHPNSVRVLDFGQERPEHGGALYIVMEYIEGRDLLSVLEEDGPFSAERAVDVMSQILDALSVAHSLGIVHRDLKPENILVRAIEIDGVSRELVTVCDFGIALLSPTRLSGHSASELVNVADAGMVVGTPAYMSPEQARAEPQDSRSDIYSAGVVLFQLLTLHVPFVADSPLAVAVMHCSDEPPAPSQFGPVNPALEEVCLRALSKSKELRYQSARDMRQALQRALQATPAPVNRVNRRWGGSRMLPSVIVPSIALGQPATAPSSLLPTEMPSTPERVQASYLRRLLPVFAIGLVVVGSASVPILRTVGGNTGPRNVTRGNDAPIRPEHFVHPAIAAQTQPVDELASVASAPVSAVLPEASASKPVATKKHEPVEKHAPAASAVAAPSAKSKPAEVTTPEVVTREAGLSESSEEPVVVPAVPAVLAREVESTPLDGASTSLAAKSESAETHASPPPTPRKPAPLTAADKQVAPSLPAVPDTARVSIGPIVARSAVSKASVRSALNMDAVTDCYRSALRSGAASAVPATGEIAITTNMGGAISSASLRAPALRDSARACIEQVVRRGRVREVDTGAAGASITLQFQPR